ncbi:hypothetical protein Tco_1105939 [Tanacetum coccineum]
MLGRQIDDENDDDENIPLHYHINKDFSISFGREKFCLVTGLRFGLQNWAEYDTKERILHLVILGVESRRAVPDWMLRLANDRVAWNKYPWGSYVWPTLYSQLRNANVKHWSPLYVAEPTNEDDAKTYSIFGYTWAFKTWILESFRVTVIRYFDRYNRYPKVAAWSKKKGRFLGDMVIPFFQGGLSSFQGHVNSSYFNMGTPPNFQTPMPYQPGSSDWQRQMPTQSATQYWQPSTSSQHGSYYSFGQVPSHMGRPNLQTTIETHHDVDGIFDQGKKANLSPLNLGGAFEDDNVEENNVIFLGSQFTGNFLMYENVDPSKVRRGNYVNLPDFLNAPHQIYLDCYMKGYIVSVSFWQQLVLHFCMPDMHRLPHGTPIGWFSGEVLYPIDLSEVTFISQEHSETRLAIANNLFPFFPLDFHDICCRHSFDEPRIEKQKIKGLFWKICKHIHEKTMHEHEHTTYCSADAHEKLVEWSSKMVRAHCP